MDDSSNYSLIELVPIVAELTNKYTSGESTSITYERANELMEAVIYCIRECEMEQGLMAKRGLSAGEVYHFGYEKVCQKVRDTQELYNELIDRFCAYGNRNYDATITKALSGFFIYYDALFAPHETIITMDYPTIRRITGCSGIDAVEKYVKCISLEQQFLGAFPEDYVRGVLKTYKEDYEFHYFNLCSIFFRHVLCKMLIGRDAGEQTAESLYIVCKKLVTGHSKEQLQELFCKITARIIQEKWGAAQELSDYLKADIPDFVTELCVAVENRRVLNYLR